MSDSSQPASALLPRRLPTVADLPDLPRSELGQLWTEFFARPVPKSISVQLLIRFLAFEIQARQMGGLPVGFVEALNKRVAVAVTGKQPATRLRPGGRLLREWGGITHVVDITDSGFLWRGSRYASLTAIAREITGTNWSGPRFFGLTDGVSAKGGKRPVTGAARKASAAKGSKAVRHSMAGDAV